MSIVITQSPPIIEMQRFKLVLQYIGTKYQGWSKQKHTSNTIQFILEKAAASIANGKPTPITISSRTDKGVHALHNIAHVDFDSVRETLRLLSSCRNSLNMI